MNYYPTNDLVSIIIPTHNRSNLLPETLQSVLNQGYPNIEIIVVDDHSTDNTEKIIEEIIKKNECNNISFIKNEGKGGCQARNTGIKNAKGDYFQFFDDDDIMESNFISYRLNVLKERQLDFVTCDYDCFKDETSHIIRAKVISNIPHTAISHIINSALPTPCFLLTRKAIDTIGFWNNKVKRQQDMAYFHRLFLYNLNGEWLDKRLFKYRVHDKSVTKQNGIETVIQSLEEMYKEWKPISKNVCLALVRLVIFHIDRNIKSTINKIYNHIKFFSKYPKEYIIIYMSIKIKKRDLFNL